MATARMAIIGGSAVAVDNTTNQLLAQTRPYSISETLQGAATVTGNGTETILAGQTQAALSVEGSATSFTVVVEGSVDGINWHMLEVVERGSLVITESITAKGIYVVDLAGLTNLRARISAIVGGNVTVLAR